GLSLVAFVFGKEGSGEKDMDRRVWLWQPGQHDPKTVASDAKLRSPDGALTVDVTPEALTIESSNGRRRFASENPQDRSPLDGLAEDPSLAEWLGPKALVLASDADVVLDLRTAKLRYLFPEGNLRFVHASPDGRRVIAEDPDNGLFWGTVADGR